MRSKITTYEELFENNRQWAAENLRKDPKYFEKMARGQKPHFLLISCSDSRVPITGITGVAPGDMFVHRNVANVVDHTDMNVLSVLQYSVEVLKVQHIIVCGHYNCGGVAASMESKPHGLIDNWLRNIRDVYRLHYRELDAISDPEQRRRRLVELNVIEQAYNVAKISFVQNAIRRAHKPLEIHGWVYEIRTGLIKDLEIDLETAYAEHGHIYEMGTS
ncbi:MAG: carbonic anhydrase [Blastocatellia bacterium]|nr:carbonic anhydrase [Blastocatellia bacterium]